MTTPSPAMATNPDKSIDPALAELFLPDPDLMGSPEGDTKGLHELQQAARERIEEQDES
jgi:hypothetical protein